MRVSKEFEVMISKVQTAHKEKHGTFISAEKILRPLLEAATENLTGRDLVLSGDTPKHESGSILLNPSQLRKLRDSLVQAVALLDGVLADGEDHVDKLGSIKAELERTLAYGGNPGVDIQDAPAIRVKKPKAR